MKILSSQENFPLYHVDKMLLISEFVRDGGREGERGNRGKTPEGYSLALSTVDQTSALDTREDPCYLHCARSHRDKSEPHS